MNDYTETKCWKYWNWPLQDVTLHQPIFVMAFRIVQGIDVDEGDAHNNNEIQ